ncbi:membrane-spanning 4-domains subfamily A member 4A-like [Spea bombifrons]|uniref:membrane-spanning 4-domains subfamily A member 4A-like n=1 Tax=Spea bombifrons TaxID=233779 RepID=UPI00234AA1C7|nr:membrane-spanning 4-domains subfamily A member 4A-like [Spea bombifrons]
MASPLSEGRVVIIPRNQVMAGSTATKPVAAAFYLSVLKGQPKALGTTQIVLSLLQISLGLIYSLSNGCVTISILTGVNFWGSVFYITSGSLSVAVENHPSISLVKGFLVMNIISSVIAVVAIIIFCIDIGEWYHGCYYWPIAKIVHLSILIVASFLQFGVSLSLSIFAWKSLDHADNPPSQVFIIPNDYVPSGPSGNPAFGNLYTASIPQDNGVPTSPTAPMYPGEQGSHAIPLPNYYGNTVSS